jgi:tRNA/rRNA methyltransferase
VAGTDRTRDARLGGPAVVLVDPQLGENIGMAARAIYDTTAEAVADLARVYAATARPRDMVKPVVTPRRAAAEMRESLAAGTPVGLLFGPERSGLVNDDLALADTLLVVPLNPAFASLNLAMAVLLVGYEWFQAADETPPRRLETGGQPPAAKAELVNFFERLEAALDETGFLHPPEKRPAMRRNLRNMFQRLDPTDQDLRTLHGIISALRSRQPGE